MDHLKSRLSDGQILNATYHSKSGLKSTDFKWIVPQILKIGNRCLKSSKHLKNRLIKSGFETWADMQRSKFNLTNVFLS